MQRNSNNSNSMVTLGIGLVSGFTGGFFGGKIFHEKAELTKQNKIKCDEEYKRCVNNAIRQADREGKVANSKTGEHCWETFLPKCYDEHGLDRRKIGKKL